MSALLRLPVIHRKGSKALVAAIKKIKINIQILEKKILCPYLFLHFLPDLSCDQFCVTRLPTLYHLELLVPGARLFRVVVAADNLTERVA